MTFALYDITYEAHPCEQIEYHCILDRGHVLHQKSTKKRSNLLFDRLDVKFQRFSLPWPLIMWFMVHGKTFLENTTSNLMNHRSTFRGLNLGGISTGSVTKPMARLWNLAPVIDG